MERQTLRDLAGQNDRRQATYQENRAYFHGRNPWLESREPRNEPDNRIATPFAKMAIEDMTGYAGMTGYRTVEIDNVRTDASAQQDAAVDEYIQLVRIIEDYNDAERLTSELYQAALVYGVAYEAFWYSSSGVEFARVPTNEIEIVDDGALKPTVLEAVRFYDRKNGMPRKATVWDAEAVTEYVREGSDWVQRGQMPHPFGRVPVAVYAINGQQEPLFQAEKGLIDALDKILSSSVNEVDRFNAVIALFPFRVDREFVDRLRQMNVIEDLDQFERWPEYLEKDLGKITTFYAELADRLERLYHKSIKVPDFSDENFVGNASGVALSYKLLGLEFKAAQIDNYFDRGIIDRYGMIGAGLNAGARQYPVDDYEIIIRNRRNLPIDDEQKVRIAQALMGIVSQETLLRMLPRTIVEDVDRELERLGEAEPLRLGPAEEPTEDDA